MGSICACKEIPETPSQYVSTVIDLINKSTPRKVARFQRENIYTVKNREFNAAIMNVVASGLAKSKSTATRRAFASSVNALKEQKLQRTAARVFKVSRNLVNKARRFKAGRKPLSNATVCLVESFYEKNSKQLPDKKLVSKRTGRAAVIATKPIAKLYREFCKSHPTVVRIGLAKFSSLRPNHVKLMGTAKFVGCVCEYCANIELKVKTINSYLLAAEAPPIKDMYDLSSLTMCQKDEGSRYYQPSCIRRECGDCGVRQLGEHLSILRGSDSTVHWKRWELVEQRVKDDKTIKKKALISKSGMMDELLSELIEEAEPFTEHLFAKDWQNQQLQQLRSNLPKDSALCILDFAENYVCRLQDEAQAAYWTHESATVHPIVTYYSCSRCTKVVTESLIMVSDDLNHDYHAVHKFQLTVNHHLIETRKLPLTNIFRFSDGCGSQYKSKGPISDISYALSDFGLRYHHNYSGSRHSKGASDGESAVMKSSSTTAVKAGNALIRNARELYEYARESLTKEPAEDGCHHHLRTIFFVSKEEINRARGDRHIKQVPGTRKLHAIRTVRDGVVEARKLSCFCEQCLRDNIALCENKLYVDDWKEVKLFSKAKIGTEATDTTAINTEPAMDTVVISPADVVDVASPVRGAATNPSSDSDQTINVNTYVAAEFMDREKSRVYMAMVTRIDGDDLQLRFMRKHKAGHYTFSPEPEALYPKRDIVAVLEEPDMVLVGRALLYSFKGIDALADKYELA